MDEILRQLGELLLAAIPTVVVFLILFFAYKLIVHKPLVAVLDGLERRGWVRRQTSPRDRRVHWVQRTEEGDRLFARALPLARRAEARQLAALPAAEQKQLVAAMRKLAANPKQ